MKLPSSSLLSFFPCENYTPRPIQIEALSFIEESIRAGKRNIIVQANTGTGKSPMAVALCRWLDNGYILTSNKMLQKQYLNEFNELKEVKGRKNFTCLINKETCNTGLCQVSRNTGKDKCPHSITPKPSVYSPVIAESYKRGKLYWSSEACDKCVYWDGKVKALNSKTVVHNYDYALYETNYAGDFGPRNVMVLDEAHNIESKLMNFLSLDITQKTIDVVSKYCKDKVSFIYTPNEWINEKKYFLHFEWIKTLLDSIKNILENDAETTRVTKVEHIDPKELYALCNLETKLANFIEEATTDGLWVVQEKRDNLDNITGLSFKPVFIKKYADKHLLHLGKINVFFSATILDVEKFAGALGLKDYAYKELEPVYLPESNRIYNLNLVNLSSNNNKDTKEDKKDLYKKVTEKIDLILDKHPNEKGIIHCNTYEIADFIREFTKHQTRMLIPATTEDKVYAINYHVDIKNKDEPTVLCSPSITEGVDFKHDLARFQILVKIPFPDKGDAQIEKRMIEDEDFYAYRTAITMIQAIGRSVRSENDWCVTYTIDNRFVSFCNRNSSMTKLFRRHIVQKKAIALTCTSDLLEPIVRKHTIFKPFSPMLKRLPKQEPILS